ncbi:MAG: NTP transferase domain-containing protein [Microlunatus sp.]|nr:NTP transferase domain-containing protein [Microlunatus sp.]
MSRHSDRTTPILAAVVLAGGASRRFGSDKLEAQVDGRPLLQLALDDLPDSARLAVVGPERPVPRSAVFLREDPPGGGPAAGLVVGLSWALGLGAEVILTLPGDAPRGGRAAAELLTVLLDSGASAVVGVDDSGHDSVLQLALRRMAAQALVAAAGPEAADGMSVRRLVAALDPPP